MNKEELYFTVSATSDEHDIIEYDIRKYCKKRDIDVRYYRQFKSEHVPTQRECKLIGDQTKFSKFRNWAATRECPIILENFWNTQDGKDHLNDVKNNLPRGSTRVDRHYGRI